MWFLLLIAFLMMAGSVPAHAGVRDDSSSLTQDASFTPHAHQFDLQLGDVSSFVDNSSVVRRHDIVAGTRPITNRGSALHFGSDLGVRTLQMPEMTASWWIDDLNAIQFQFRYFALYGSHHLSQSVTFNRAVITPGQDLSPAGTTWFTGGLFYEGRVTPWLAVQEHTMPEFLQHWDLRPKIGLEFVYLDFQLNNAHPRVQSGGLDARGRWHDQELPVPTIGIEARRALCENLMLEITGQGNWVNHWDSLRSENGTVYLSQSSFETHWTVSYYNAALRGVHPYLGIDYYFYKQAENSHSLGNLIRLQSFGPEFGVSYSH